MAAVGTPGGILHIIFNIPTVNALTVQKLHRTTLPAVAKLAVTHRYHRYHRHLAETNDTSDCRKKPASIEP